MSYQGRSGTEAEKEVAFYFPKAIKKIIQHGEDGYIQPILKGAC